VSAKESAAKDIQIAKLQMQLELAAEKAKLRAEFETGRLERADTREKIRRVSQTKMYSGNTIFALLMSTSWDNEGDAGVNSFSRLTIYDNPDDVREPITLMPQLESRLLAGPSTAANDQNSNVTYRSFGICYRGPAISAKTLQKGHFIKEAYGVEVDGVHHVCFICFKRYGRYLDSISTAPYAFGVLPCTIVADMIPGRDYQLAVYKTSIETDDPVLEALKRPSMDKWFWHSAGNRD